MVRARFSQQRRKALLCDSHTCPNWHVLMTARRRAIDVSPLAEIAGILFVATVRSWAPIKGFRPSTHCAGLKPPSSTQLFPAVVVPEMPSLTSSAPTM